MVRGELVKAAGRPETSRLYRTFCRWWNEIDVLMITGTTNGDVEANNTAIKNIKRTARSTLTPLITDGYSLGSAVRTPG